MSYRRQTGSSWEGASDWWARDDNWWARDDSSDPDAAWEDSIRQSWSYSAPASHSWDPPVQREKRARSRSPSEEPDQEAKKVKMSVIDASIDEIDKSGNAVDDSVKWISQEDPCMLGHPVTQAMWLVTEKSYDFYAQAEQTWFRPALQLSDVLEAQFQANIGCQTCELTYPKTDGTFIKHYFEHDLRGQEWVQKRFRDSSKSEIKSSKKILRVMIG